MGKEREQVSVGRQRRHYAREFKLEAVRLLERKDKPAAQLALELGVRRNQLYKWQKELIKGEAAFPGSGRNRAERRGELERLRAELERVTQERDILKKAAAYFAREIK